MAIKEPSFTIGIEEEYLLVDKASRDVAQEPPAELLTKCEEALRGQVSPEFLRSQIEVGTRVCKSMHEARDQLSHRRFDPPLRAMVGPTAHRQGALQRARPRPAASGTQARDLRHACSCRHR